MPQQEWIPIIGQFEQSKDRLVFAGGEFPLPEGQANTTSPFRGLALVNEKFAGGTITATLDLSRVDPDTAAELVLYHDPATGFLVTAGIGGGFSMFAVRQFDGQKWFSHRTVGYIMNVQANKKYRVSATVRGSRVLLNVNEIDVLSVDLPYSLPHTQVGVSCTSRGSITISDFRVEGQRAKVFVIMQFSSPYDELYSTVIKSICDEFGLDVIRADEEYGPGIIIADVVRQLAEAQIIVAEITPSNPNVYYEVGYAHALGKDTILLAERSLKLPFDVSPFRTLFYENTIDGKGKIEDGLRKHIRAILANQHIGDTAP